MSRGTSMPSGLGTGLVEVVVDVDQTRGTPRLLPTDLPPLMVLKDTVSVCPGARTQFVLLSEKAKVSLKALFASARNASEENTYLKSDQCWPPARSRIGGYSLVIGVHAGTRCRRSASPPVRRFWVVLPGQLLGALDATSAGVAVG